MDKNNLTVLSLFDGMSCMRITLEKMGITPSKYYASEIDPHANKEVAANWPDTIQLGDVTKWREWDVDWSKVDLLVGGSPCQGFSFAGKQAGTKANLNGVDFIIGTREQYLQAKADGATFYSQSHLFWEYVLCLDYAKEQNPNINFMLENVKMKKCFLDMITEALGVEPVFINAALVSAQNRQRYYWASWKITQPEDRGILLADIIESGAVDRDKSFCIDANYFKGGSLKNYLEKKRRWLVFGEKVNYSQSEKRLMVETFEEWYAKTKDWGGTREEWEALQMQVNSAAIVGRKINPETGKREDNNANLPTVQTLEAQPHGKARCLSTVSKDCLVSNLPPGRYRVNDNNRVKEITENDHGYRPHRGDERKTGISELGRIYKSKAKVHTLTTSHQPKLALNDDIKDLHYRKLTVVECCRLQGVPDNYFKVSSNTQAYKMLGNGWQCDTIEHILNCLFLEK